MRRILLLMAVSILALSPSAALADDPPPPDINACIQEIQELLEGPPGDSGACAAAVQATPPWAVWTIQWHDYQTMNRAECPEHFEGRTFITSSGAWTCAADPGSSTGFSWQRL